MKKKAILSMLLAMTMFPMAACSETQVEPQPVVVTNSPVVATAAESNYTVWTTNALEKICRDVQYDASKMTGKAIDLSMCRNESEGGQIIITAEEDIASYTVSVSALTCGTNIIPIGNISVYNEKYIEVLEKHNSNNEFAPNTFVPDAILPFDTAVEYGENKVKAGQNQGIYVEVKTESYMAPGDYTGTITLTVDGEVHLIPMNVTVYDFVISETGTLQSHMALRDRDMWGSLELDSSDEMTTAYFETLLEYRMSDALPFSGKGGAERYVELLRKYYNWTGFTTYKFYYEQDHAGESQYKGIPHVNIDVPLLKTYLKEIVYASLEDNINYLDKAMFYYDNWIDEPHTEGQYQNCVNCNNFHKTVLADTADELRQELIDSDNYRYFVDVVFDTLKNIPVVLPEINFATKGILEQRGADNFTHCPEIDVLNSQEAVDYYASDDNDFWTYTCMGPMYPYPSNHIDDYLTGWRTLFWMCKAYGAKGYLNWSVANYSVNHYGDDYKTWHMVDAYDVCFRASYPGDGFMFYPGAQYGIYGPVSSLRSVAYRDGMEEYEYLTVLENLYTDAGVDASNILDSFYERLFYASIPTTSSNVLLETRDSLCSMIESAYGDFGIVIDSIQVNRTVATVKFKTSNLDAEVYMDGAKLTMKDGVYSAELDLSKNNYLNLTLKVDGESKDISTRIAGRASVIETEKESDLSIFNIKQESSMAINTDATYILSGNASAKFTLRGKYYGLGNESQTYAYEPFIRVDASVFGDTSKLENIYLNIYNASDKPLTVSFSYYTNRSNYISEYVLKPGWNSVTLKNVYSLDNIANVKYFFIRTANLLGPMGSELSVDLYLDDIIYSQI